MNNKLNAPSYNVLFLCIRNRVRSVFAELFTRDKLIKMDGNLSHVITVNSAGFFPQEVRTYLDKLNAAPPDPFYGVDMSEHVRSQLHKREIAVPDVWQSKCVTPEMIKKSNLIVVAIPSQKKELGELYPEYRQNIVSLKEIAKWKDAVLSEDFSQVPMQGNVWAHWEENQQYVYKTIEEVEKLLTMAIPRIVMRLL